jgi:hypothetical protein
MLKPSIFMSIGIRGTFDPLTGIKYIYLQQSFFLKKMALNIRQKIFPIVCTTFIFQADKSLFSLLTVYHPDVRQF